MTIETLGFVINGSREAIARINLDFFPIQTNEIHGI